MKYLITLLFFFALHANENSQPVDDGRAAFSLESEAFHIVDIEGEPTSIVDGCVNVISGDFVDMEQDLVMPGSLPLTIERSYCSSDRSKGNLAFGWNLNLGGVIGWIANGKTKILGWKGSHGRELHFKKAKDSIFYLDENVLKRGVTNNASGYISGKTNLKNCLIKKNTPKKYNYTICTGDGSELTFKYDEKSGSYYDLTTETKPNGMTYYYEYFPNSGFIKNVTIKNPQGNARQKIHYNYKELKNKEKDLQITLMGNDLRQIKYTFKLGKYLVGEVKKFRYFVKEVERPEQITQKYSYEKIDNFERVIRKESGKNFIDISYYKEGHYGKIKIDPTHRWFNKVHAIRKPLGTTNLPEIAYTFQYHIPDKHKAGACAVFNADGVKTDYNWNDEHRLTHINRFNKQGHLYTEDRLYWGADDEESYLKSRVYSCNGQAIFCKNYTYDSFGNVLNEKLYGNITGLNSQPILLNQEGMALENGIEKLEKQFVYSQDGRNLLLQEVQGSHKKIYEYYQHNSLLACEYYYFNENLTQRRFFSYDQDCNMIFEITDNGLSTNPEDLFGVTVRKVKKITPTNSLPWGLPHIVEDFGIDLVNMREVLERKVYNFYNPAGKVIRQDHYGSDSAYAFSLYWEYDTKGNLIRETNAVGEVIHREYDENGNLILESRPGPSPTKKFDYDFCNRLICASEYHPDIILSTHYSYNFLGQKTSEVDPYGNVKTFEYDDFGRLVTTNLPSLIDGYGQVLSPTIIKSYDGFGNVIFKKDENGNETFIEYTVRGQPSKIIYPDGSKEYFVYYLHGPLMAKTERNGCSTKYTRDFKDRIVKTEFYSPNGSLIWVKEAIFDVFNVIEETDVSGYKTYYSYDAIGRKIRMTKEGMVETYEYDVLGRMVKQSTLYDDQEAITKIQSFDLLNRVIEEKKEDSRGMVTSLFHYAYDSQGNRIKIISYGEDAVPQFNEFRYDSHGLVSETVDPYGNITRSRFLVERNEHDQLVQCTEVIDSLGNTTHIMKDAYGREAISERKNPFGEVIQKQEFFHDPIGNLCKTVETVIVNEKPTRQVITFWVFDAMNRVASLVEGLTTPEQKTTRFIYNSAGQLDIIEKPDGQRVLHTYHPDGMMASYSSESFNYRYEYDVEQRLTHSYDTVTQQGFKRVYNSLGHLVEEIQNEFTIKYKRDTIGRANLLELPDASKIAYEYQGALLKKISRLSASGEIYSHSYDCYDLSGNITQETMINQRSKIQRTFDLKNRITRSKSNFYEEVNVYDSENNLLSKEFHDSLGEATNVYCYDSLNQLTSESGCANHTYSFDSVYNRLAKDDKKYNFNSLNQILPSNNENHLYDENGNLTECPTSDGVIRYSYDAIGRLISSSKNDTLTTYAYDSLNRRISKTTQDQTTYFIYDEQNEIGAIQNNKIVELRVLGTGLGAEIGAAVAFELQDAIYAPIHNFTGSVTALINSNNQIAECYRYSAFGEEMTPAKLSNPWRFCSKRTDDETGLVYFGNRYYDPSLGRWTSQDPLGYEDGPNLYAYVCNSPLIHFDAFGLYYEHNSPNIISYLDKYDSWFADGKEAAWYRYAQNDNPNLGIGFINGVWNSLFDLRDSAFYLRGLGAENLYMLYNPSHGIIPDLDECTAGLHGFATTPVRVLHDQWDDFFKRASLDAIFLQICHSQGAIHVKNALQDYPEELRKRIEIVAIAPAAYIDPNLCHKVYHYRAKAWRDLIPRINRSGIARAGGTIFTLSSHEDAPWFDHNFNSPTYRQILFEHVKIYQAQGNKV